MAANRTSISMTGCGIATRLAADRGAPIAAGENPHAAPTSVAAIKMREERTGIRDEGCHHSREASLSLWTCHVSDTCPRHIHVPVPSSPAEARGREGGYAARSYA